MPKHGRENCFKYSECCNNFSDGEKQIFVYASLRQVLTQGSCSKQKIYSKSIMQPSDFEIQQSRSQSSGNN